MESVNYSGNRAAHPWLKQVDMIAGHLEKLKEAHVPVLWRPYHEMNGVWFWWGNRKGKEGSRKLYKMLYDRFVNHFHLNNLLWVWDANGPWDIPFDEAYAYRDFYPGADYVDILATDVYHFDFEQNDYVQLLKLADGKPIALGEVGELPLPRIIKTQPKWTWFMVWSNWIETVNTKERVRAIYNDSHVLTHNQVHIGANENTEEK